MAGLISYMSIGRLYANRVGREYSSEFEDGLLVPEVMDAPSRGSHCRGGAGVIYPKHDQLNMSASSWDNRCVKDGIMEAPIDFELLFATNKHLPIGDYRSGIILHLLWDSTLESQMGINLFDFSYQKEGVVIDRATGKEIEAKSFKRILKIFDYVQDQYMGHKAGIKEDEIITLKNKIYYRLPEDWAYYCRCNLNYTDAEESIPDPYARPDFFNGVIEATLNEAMSLGI